MFAYLHNAYLCLLSHCAFALSFLLFFSFFFNADFTLRCGYHRRYNSDAAFAAMEALAAEGKFKGACFEDWLDAPPHQGLSAAVDDALAFFEERGGADAPRAVEVATQPALERTSEATNQRHERKRVSLVGWLGTSPPC
jgi:hypothetical protein